MKITFHADNKLLQCQRGDNITDIAASCIVRNELNRKRPLHDPMQVVYAIVDDHYNRYPYMPRTFPTGTWRIYTPRARTSGYLAPYFIPTDAEQLVNVWSLDKDGGYAFPLPDRVLDIGYGLHFSESITTVGCIRIHQLEDLLWLVKAINAETEQGEQTTITA